MSGAVDRDGDGNVDLDDVYHYLESIKFEGPRPERNFDGSGAITIARRSFVPPTRNEIVVKKTSSRISDNVSALTSGALTVPAYLEIEVPGASFSADKVAEFRHLMRDDMLDRIPSQLSSKEFLRRAGVLKGDTLTYAGILLFGDNPTEVLPTAMVQCVRFIGTAKTDPLEIIDLQGTVPENIVRARDFVAGFSRLGETVSAKDAYADTTYKFPMIAVREIIANAIVHRDYEKQESCVQIHAYSDRIEIINPGQWAGSSIIDESEIPLGQLERQSWRPNFRLARILTWSKLVEGVGAGLPRAVADCRAIGAPEPTVMNDDRTVTVTIYPRKIQPGRDTSTWGAGSSPMYQMIAEDLRERIESNDLRPGQQLPNEIQLRDEYRASRNTVRDAIRWLASRGLVVTRPGEGTFVVESITPLVVTLDSDAGVDAEQKVPTVSPPRVEIQQASKAIAAALRLEETDQVVSRQEDRYIDNVPWSIQTSFYPMRFVEQGAVNLIQPQIIEAGAVNYLGESLGIRQVGYRDRITVRAPDSREVEFFRLPEDGRIPVFEVLRTAYGQDTNPIRVTISIFPTDRNRFIVGHGTAIEPPRAEQ